MTLTVGTLTGLAIGDALGMAFETQGPWSDELLGWDGTYQGSQYHGLQPGQWTDDTQMSLALGGTLLEAGGFSGHLVATAYLAWYLSGARGIGKNTRRAMEKLKAGANWRASGIPSAEGNGTAMRATPLGLFCAEAGNYAQARDWAILDAGITHNSMEAQDGSVVMALSVLHLLQPKPKALLLTTMLETVRQYLWNGTTMNDKVVEIQGLWGQASFEDVVARMGWIQGAGARVTDSVPAALTCFLWSDSFQETVMRAVQMGGDTDTTASMAGALAGTYWGYEGIPQRLIDGLEDHRDIHRMELALVGGR